MIKKDEYTCIRLFSNCKIVKGYSRACICDIQRNRVYTIPLSLSGIFDENGVCQIDVFENKLEEDCKFVFQEYLTFILEHELGFYCSIEELECFPHLPDEFLFPARISNAILDTDSKFEYIHEGILDQLAFLGCHFLQLRCYNPIRFSDLQIILDLIAWSSVKSIDIVLPYDKTNHAFYSEVWKITTKNGKLSCLTITGADKDECILNGRFGRGVIFKSQNTFNSELHCGIISRELFTINIPTYTESLSHNTCLNRKIAIDTKGNIKNCPSMKASYGNICNTTLEEAINKPGFTQYWDIRKAEITKCKDCEFRHVCTDCRAYLDDPDDIYSAPLKCGYDPYTCEWEDWSTNPLKQLAIMNYQIPVKY